MLVIWIWLVRYYNSTCGSFGSHLWSVIIYPADQLWHGQFTIQGCWFEHDGPCVVHGAWTCVRFHLISDHRTVVMLTKHFLSRPDVSLHVQKLEQEKTAKDRGETKDNRSFLAKYVSDNQLTFWHSSILNNSQWYPTVDVHRPFGTGLRHVRSKQPRAAGSSVRAKPHPNQIINWASSKLFLPPYLSRMDVNESYE